ncbi:MAG: ABC transporter permease, partial [Mycobacteriales bacterium]
MTRVRTLAVRWSGWLTLIAVVVVIAGLPGPWTPLGIIGTGVVSGSQLALAAIGLVLTFRGNRIINFAQVQVAAFGGVLFLVLVKFQTFLVIGHHFFAGVIPDEVSAGWAWDVNYGLAILAGLGFAAGFSWLIYFVLLKRLDAAPRLVASVATLFVAELIAGGQQKVLNLFKKKQISLGLIRVLQRSVLPPFHVHFTIGPASFDAVDVLSVCVTAVAVVALTVFLRRSRTGVALRATAESPQRALTLGVPIGKVTGRLWLLVGLLAGTTGVIGAMATTATSLLPSNSAPDPFALSTLALVLAVCVLARFTSLPLTACGAVVFGVLVDAVAWWNGSAAVLPGFLFVIILLTLLVQTSSSSRAVTLAASAWRSVREIRPTPAELRSVPSVRFWRRAGIVAGAGVVLLAPWLLTVGQTSLASVMVITAIIGESLLVLTGWAGQISLGQFGLAALGGYLVGVTHLPFLVALLLAGLAGAAGAVLIGLPALRLRGLHLAVTTLAFAYAVDQIVLAPNELGRYVRQSITRPDLLGLSLNDGRTFYYFAVVVLLLAVVALVGIRRSRVGRTLLAIRDNEVAAQLFGIPFVRAQLGAFAISGFIAAIGGALLAYNQYAVNATSFAPSQSLLLFLAVLIGGLGSVSSPLIGVLLFGLLQIFGVATVDQELTIGIIGLIAVRLAPGGLGMILFNGRDAVLRRVARRYRISVPSLLADVAGADWEHPVSPIRPKSRSGGGTV